jgi:hypothetical protein
MVPQNMFCKVSILRQLEEYSQPVDLFILVLKMKISQTKERADQNRLHYNL